MSRDEILEKLKVKRYSQSTMMATRKDSLKDEAAEDVDILSLTAKNNRAMKVFNEMWT